MSSPTVDHWAAVEQILCYLKGALGRGILYNNHGMIDLSVSQMLIEQDLRRTDERVRNKVLFFDIVQSLNIER